MWLILCIVFTLLSNSALADDDADYAAMPDTNGKDIVFSLCSQCHSMDIVFQQRLSRSRWNKLMDWMTNEMGMIELFPDERKLIVDYLTRHYGITVRR